MTWMPDDDPGSRETAEHWGFRLVSHAIRSRLDLSPGMPRPASTGSLELQVLDGSAPATGKASLEVLLNRSATYPEAVELGWKSSVAEFEQTFPGMIWVVLQDHSDAVAVASAQPRRHGPWLVIYTGVLPERRGHGLARLAKQHLHALVRQP